MSLTQPSHKKSPHPSTLAPPFNAIWTNNFELWTNTIYYLDKYIWKFVQIQFEVWTNTSSYFDKYITKVEAMDLHQILSPA